MNFDEVKALVDGLTEKKYPLSEDVDGRTYFHIRGSSARDVALLLLWKRHPKRFGRDDLIAMVGRHNFTKENATRGVDRLRGVVDDIAGNLRLLQPGLREAERLLAAAQSEEPSAASRRRPRRRARRRTTPRAMTSARVR